MFGADLLGAPQSRYQQRDASISFHSVLAAGRALGRSRHAFR
jgi:hypothetical protein